MQANLFYKPKTLQVGEFKGVFEQAVSAVLGANAQITVTHRRDTGRAGVTDNIRLDTESLRAVVDLSRAEFTLIADTSVSQTFPSKHVFLSCHSFAGLFYVIAHGEESVQCLERMALNLGLERTEAPADDTIQRLELRVSALEKAMSDAESKLKCFISLKFDDARTVAQVDRLKRVLAAVHIEWVTGEQFEPRRIEDTKRSFELT